MLLSPLISLSLSPPPPLHDECNQGEDWKEKDQLMQSSIISFFFAEFLDGLSEWVCEWTLIALAFP